MTGSGAGAPPGRGRPTRPTRAGTDLLALALWWCWPAWSLGQRQPATPYVQCGAHLCALLFCCVLLWWAESALNPPSPLHPRPPDAAVALAPPLLSTHTPHSLLQHSKAPKGSALQEAHVQWQLQEAVRASPALLAALLLFAIFPVSKIAGARRAQRRWTRPLPYLRRRHHQHRGRGRRRMLRRQSQRHRH
jgi:hypothetical protein